MSFNETNERSRSKYKPRFHRLQYRRRRSELELERALDQFRYLDADVWQDSQQMSESQLSCA